MNNQAQCPVHKLTAEGSGSSGALPHVILVILLDFSTVCYRFLQLLTARKTASGSERSSAFKDIQNFVLRKT